MSTFDWDSRPQRDRRRRDSSSGESTAGNSSSGSFAPYYRNPYFSSLEEDYEHDEMMFKAAGVEIEPIDRVLSEETDGSPFDLLDDIDWDEDEIAFRAAGVNLYDDVPAAPVSLNQVTYNYLDAGESEIANTENLEETTQAEAEVAQEVLAGALMGDFNNDPTFWSDVGQIVTGLIPIAGQLGDARDLIHALDDIFNKEGFKKIASWATLVLIVIGFIPGVGDAIKSIGRRGIRYLDNNGIIKRIGQWLGNNVISPILDVVGDITAPLVGRIKNAIRSKLDDTHQIARQAYDLVWEKIEPTASVIRGTEIPATFNVSAGGQKFWVNANGSEHMAEYVLSRDLNNLHPYNIDLINQIVLTQFQAAVETAVQQGIKYDEMMTVGNYELIFRPARQEGLNPVISHARYIGGQR